jgi:hypothetical protein
VNQNMVHILFSFIKAYSGLKKIGKIAFLGNFCC